VVTEARRRVVYSTRSGRLCGTCGWPEADCRCSSKLSTKPEALPERLKVTLSVEKRGSGKIVTVIDGLPGNTEFLVGLARELKKSCGTGGRAGPDFVEIQGDHRERLRELLQRRGWQVKG
jgi:translation initiation factor 1